MIACEDDDVLAERKGLGYGMDCRIRGHVFDGFPPKPTAVTTARQFEQYVLINRNRMNRRHSKRTSDQDWEFWDRRLA